MKIIRKQYKFCYSCMKEHEVSYVQIEQHVKYLNDWVRYDAIYEYCGETDCLSEDTKMLGENDTAMKDAYRKQKGLMTSTEIKALRKQYQISQAELASILGWGAKTITRYETYQVQDAAHDNILKRLQQDPQWFMELLAKRQDMMAQRRYMKYYNAACEMCSKQKNHYTEKMMHTLYLEKQVNKMDAGNTNLDIDKVEEMLNYIASKEVAALYLLKMGKLLWYADCLHYKRNQQSITGLAYRMQQLGVMPIGYEYLTTLSGVNCVDQEVGDGISHLFLSVEKFVPKHLTQQEVQCIDQVVEQFRSISNQELSKRMAIESAVRNTQLNEIVSYEYAESLSIA